MWGSITPNRKCLCICYTMLNLHSFLSYKWQTNINRWLIQSCPAAYTLASWWIQSNGVYVLVGLRTKLSIIFPKFLLEMRPVPLSRFVQNTFLYQISISFFVSINVLTVDVAPIWNYVKVIAIMASSLFLNLNCFGRQWRFDVWLNIFFYWLWLWRVTFRKSPLT